MADVLIVDDEPSVLELLERFVVDEGYTVATATDGQMALSMLDDVSPSLVLADNMMPRLTGIELAATIGARDTGNAPPIVVMSANHASLRNAVDAVAVLPKPFDLDALLSLVQRYCGETRQPH